MAQHNGTSYRLPAEWEAQRGMQLTWPHADTDWQPYLEEITGTCLQLAREIALREPLLVVTPHVEETRAQLSQALGEGLMQRVTLYEIDTNDTWARDHGVITLLPSTTDKEQNQPDLLLNFKFNGWGEKFDWQKDNAINAQLHDKGAITGILEDHNDFVLEGGSIESDGCGTILTTSACLLAPHRNQPLNRAEIERQLLTRLHADRILWIDHGSLLGDDTDGHVDTTVRFAPDDTLAYVGCDDSNDPQWADFDAMEKQLQQFRTADGRPYRLLRLPMPRAMYDGEDRLPATYANFVVINGAVIVPTYGQPDLDRQALDVIAQAFPGREIIGIDASTVVRQHGSLHCLTMQFPKRGIKL